MDKNQNLTIIGEIKKLAQIQKNAITTLRKSNGKKSSKSMPVLRELEFVAMTWVRHSKFTKFALGEIFYYFRDSWDSLPDEFTQAYEGYDDYITQKYEVGRQMADMYADVWVACFSGQYLKPSDVPKYVDFGKLSVPKLRAVVPYIIRKQMNPSRWKVLSDPTISRKEITRQLRTVKGSITASVPKNSKTFFDKTTGDLRMYVDGKIEQVGFLNINNTNPIVRQEIDRILRRSRVKGQSK